MKTIVVPLDGSEAAEQALAVAISISQKSCRSLTLVTAIVEGDRWVDGGYSRELEQQEQAAVDRYLGSMAERVRDVGLEVTTRVDWGHPDVVITAVVKEVAADLIVMTTQGRSGFGRHALGGVVEKLLRAVRTPLLLIRPTEDGSGLRTIDRILVPLDGSALAEAALPQAEAMARDLGASLLLVRAVVPPDAVYGREFVPGTLPVLNDIEASAIEYLDEVARKVRSRGFEVDTEATVGLPASVILEFAGARHADLIVLTTHGRTGLKKWFLGSVADAVVRYGELPVLLVRPFALADEEEELEEGPQALMAGVSNVVPVPDLSETLLEARPEPQEREPRPHRPERSPGR